MAKRLTGWAVAAMTCGLLLFLGFNFHWRLVVHIAPVPGLEGQRVEVFRHVSLLDRDGPVYVRFPDGAETKRPFFDRGTDDAEIRRAAAEYDSYTLSVTAGERQVRVAAYAP